MVNKSILPVTNFMKTAERKINDLRISRKKTASSKFVTKIKTIVKLDNGISLVLKKIYNTISAPETWYQNIEKRVMSLSIRTDGVEETSENKQWRMEFAELQQEFKETKRSRLEWQDMLTEKKSKLDLSFFIDSFEGDSVVRALQKTLQYIESNQKKSMLAIEKN